MKTEVPCFIIFESDITQEIRTLLRNTVGLFPTSEWK